MSEADQKLFDISVKIRNEVITSGVRVDPRRCDSCNLQLKAVAGGWVCPSSTCDYFQSLLKPSTTA